MNRIENNFNSYCHRALDEIDDVRKDLNILKSNLTYGNKNDFRAPLLRIILNFEKSSML